MILISVNRIRWKYFWDSRNSPEKPGVRDGRYIVSLLKHSSRVVRFNCTTPSFDGAEFGAVFLSLLR